MTLDKTAEAYHGKEPSAWSKRHHDGIYRDASKLQPNLPKFLSSNWSSPLGKSSRDWAGRSLTRQGRSAISRHWNATSIGHEISHQAPLIWCNHGPSRVVSGGAASSAEKRCRGTDDDVQSSCTWLIEIRLSLAARFSPWQKPQDAFSSSSWTLAGAERRCRIRIDRECPYGYAYQASASVLASRFPSTHAPDAAAAVSVSGK